MRTPRALAELVPALCALCQAHPQAAARRQLAGLLFGLIKRPNEAQVGASTMATWHMGLHSWRCICTLRPPPACDHLLNSAFPAVPPLVAATAGSPCTAACLPGVPVSTVCLACWELC